MDAIASLITSLKIVYSTVYSVADQRKQQSSASPVNSPHKWPVTLKMFPFDDVIMISACHSNPSEKHFKLKPHEISHNLCLCITILLWKFAVSLPCSVEIFKTDLTTKIDVLDKGDLTRFEFKMILGRLILFVVGSVSVPSLTGWYTFLCCKTDSAVWTWAQIPSVFIFCHWHLNQTYRQNCWIFILVDICSDNEMAFVRRRVITWASADVLII